MTFNQQHYRQDKQGDEAALDASRRNGTKKLNVEAFQTLHHQYQERLLWSMVGMLRDKEQAEDVTSAAFETAFDKRADFREDSSFYTWVYAIALNQARHSRSRKGVSLDAIGGTTPSALIEPDLLLETQARLEQRGALQNALGQIPKVYRQVLLDHFVHQYSVKRIAKLRRIPLGTVLSRIYTGKRLLRQAWVAVT
jgi:RNA polymerase sigma-70 factor (ECF subfamily)